MKGFLEFVREQGVVGLAVGFILGGAVAKLVAALVSDIINPVIALGMGNVENIKEAYIKIGSSKIMWGDFVSVLIDFIVVALVVYAAVKLLRLDKLDKKKE